MIKRCTWLLVIVTTAFGAGSSANAAPVSVVAAEKVYGDIAAQLGGNDVQVRSILTNPDDDPHLFEASPTVARSVASADIIIENGAAYDPWMAKLMSASATDARDVIVVSNLVQAASGANPHLWYDPEIVANFARNLTALLARRDPGNASEYRLRLQAFTASLASLNAKIALMRARFAGQSVTATEPVFGYMAQALGLAMRNERFQLAVMNDTEPAAADVAAFENDLRQHRVRALLYNSQATDEQSARLRDLARQAKIPVVGVTETEPPGHTYQTWMLEQLDALDRALSKGTL